MKIASGCLTFLALALAFAALAQSEEPKPWITYEGTPSTNGTPKLGEGKHIVFVTGEEEYRSEQSMPPLAKILAKHHGFRCTVLFAINPESGTIEPTKLDNIPGLEKLDSADLMVMFLRFRCLPDDQMRHIIDYTNSGRPILALRTSTHPFAYPSNSQSPYAKYDWHNQDPAFLGGYGRQVLGETWIRHYGDHQKESTRGLIAPGMEQHPIVRGIDDIWGPSDVYGLTEIEGDAKPLILGQVLTGMKPTDTPNEEKKLTPVVWLKHYTGTSGKPARVFTTTMGHAGDLESEGFRRLLVNGCYWCLGMEDKIPARSQADLLDPYNPTPIGFGKFTPGVKPSDLK